MPVYGSYGTKTIPLGNGPVSSCLLGNRIEPLPGISDHDTMVYVNTVRVSLYNSAISFSEK